MRLQSGGGKQYIGDLTPEITSADTLSANCDFFYVSGHGETDFNGWMIVPENTFIVFIAFSGFITKVAHKAEWLIHDDTPAAYFKGMYDTYFREGGSKAKPRPYADQHVYVPGDLLPITMIDFRSGFQPRWDKGVFECPVKDPSIFDIDAPENNLVFVISELYNDGKGVPSIKSALIPEKKYEWDTFVGLSKAARLQLLRENPTNKRISAWFINPEIYIEGILNKEFKSNPDSLWHKKHPYQSNAILPHLVTDVATTRKPYKFIIVSSCRPPVNFLQADPGFWFQRNDLKAIISATDPRNLPTHINTRRRLARRASFSIKPSEEICATVDDPPMNLSKAMAALDAVSTLMPIGRMEDTFIEKLLALFYSEGSGAAAKPRELWLKIQDVAEVLLNRVFYPYPVLTSEEAEDAPKRAAFTLLIDSIKAALGAFMIGVQFDSKTDEKRAQLLGRQLLEQAGHPDLEHPLNDANQAAIVQAQKAFVEDPKWAALKAPRNVASQRAIQSAYNRIEQEERTLALLDAVEPTKPDMNKFREYFKEQTVEKENRAKKVAEEIRAIAIEQEKFEEFDREITELVKPETIQVYFDYSSIPYTVSLATLADSKRSLADIKTRVAILESKVEKAFEKYTELRRAYPTTRVSMMSYYNSQIARIHTYVGILKKNMRMLEEHIAKMERVSRVAPKPAVKPRNSKGATKKNRASGVAPAAPAPAAKPAWNEKELLKWRVQWLTGERNPKRDEARLKQWSAYRSGLTAEQRQAQNRNLTRRAGARGRN